MTSPPEPEAPGEVVDVLAVDDNPNNLGSLEALLTDLRANVIKAHSGDEALRHLLTRDFAVILLDIQMPGLDGYETAKLVRARARSRHIPIIFITAHSADEAAVARGYSLGAVDFLFKPIIGEVLKAKVSVFLELTRKRQQVARQAELVQRAEHLEHERALAESRRQIEREQQRRVTEALELLASTGSQLLTGAVDQPRLEQLYANLAHQLKLDAVIEHRVMPPRDALVLSTTVGLGAAEREALADAPEGARLADAVATDRARRVVSEGGGADGKPFPNIRAAGLTSVACFPLLAAQRLVGTLTFGNRSIRKFSTDELGMMQNFADLIGAAMERQRLLDELEDRDRRKNEFLAMLAHELRNPLAPIVTSIELLKMPNVKQATVQRAIASTERQVVHMTRMLDDLLDVSRITKGKVELKRSPVMLTTVIEQAVQTAERLVKERKHALEVKVPDEAVVMDADPTRLTQVVANLLNNAAKYTPASGHIRLTAEHDGDSVRIQVADDGVGIRRELLPRVFDIFVQADPTSDRAQGGLGLGLTLVRQLVELHGGTVHAHSDGLGKGSQFTVTLPVKQGPGSGPTSRAERSTLGELTPMTVLLVEDNPDIRGRMRDLFEAHGHHVEEASDGQQGLDMLLANPPRLAIVDIGLPRLDGYGLASAVRASPIARDTLLIAMTGYGQPEEKERALQSGFDAHFVKPLSMDDLSTLLKSKLSSKDL